MFAPILGLPHSSVPVGWVRFGFHASWIEVPHHCLPLLSSRFISSFFCAEPQEGAIERYFDFPALGRLCLSYASFVAIWAFLKNSYPSSSTDVTDRSSVSFFPSVLFPGRFVLASPQIGHCPCFFPDRQSFLSTSQLLDWVDPLSPSLSFCGLFRDALWRRVSPFQPVCRGFHDFPPTALSLLRARIAGPVSSLLRRPSLHPA